MPTYEYQCIECGPFTAFRPMAEFRDPQPCPVCAMAAPRATLTAPQLGGTDAGRRPARENHSGACGCCRPARSRLRAESVPAST